MPRAVLPSCQPLQPPHRLIQCLRLFAERETYLLGSVFRMFVETRSRHACDTDFFYQVSRELDAVAEPKGADVGHHVISAPWKVTAEPGFLQCRNQMIASRAVTVGQFAIVTARQAQRGRSRFLQRRGRAHGQEVVHLAARVRDGGTRNGPADAPSRYAVAFW